MKRINFIIVLVSLHSCVNAQIYFKAITGYSFSSNPQIFQSTEIISGYENVYFSKFKNGEGINLGLALGYAFQNNFSFEIVSNTQLLTTQNISIPQHDYRTINNFAFSGYFGEIKYINSIFQFSPQIVYNIDYKSIKFYLKTGPNLMIVKNNTQHDNTSWDLVNLEWIPNDLAMETNTKGSICIGIQSSIGIEYQLLKKINFFIELLSVNSNYKFKESEVVRYDIDGVNHFADLDNYGQSKIDEKINFSHFGFNLGLKYVFNNKLNNN